MVLLFLKVGEGSVGFIEGRGVLVFFSLCGEEKGGVVVMELDFSVWGGGYA